MHLDQKLPERRRHPRQELNTVGTAYVLCQSKVMAIRIWTRNVSEGGALIVSEEELRGERMLLQLPLPRFEGALVECDVRHKSCFEHIAITGATSLLYAYGLQFGRVLRESEVHKSLLGAFPGSMNDASCRADLNSRPLASTQSSERKSLVPFLSAIGLAVVFASRHSWG